MCGCCHECISPSSIPRTPHRGAGGLSIQAAGTNVGVVTDLDGKFSLTMPKGKTVLRVSYVGMETVEVVGKRNMRIALKHENTDLDEIVVVAYGTAKRQSITGSVSVVGEEKIKDRITTSVTAALEGSAPGIQVNNTYGEPGSAPTIRIRGIGSLVGSAQSPLYVVDGVVFDGNISELNPNDIESMSVLKDAASAALYGNRAANGVILITTKKGKGAGKPQISLKVNHGFYNRGIPEYERLGADQWMEASWTAMKNFAMSGSMGLDEASAKAYASQHLVPDYVQRNIYDRDYDDLFDENGKLIANVLAGYTDLDWEKDIERTGHRQEYNVAASMASEKYNVYSSIGYLKEDGYVRGVGYERFNGRVNTMFTPNKWFKTGFNLNATYANHNFNANADGNAYANPFYIARYMAPVYPLYLHNEDGSFLLDEFGNVQYDTTSPYLDNRNIAYEIGQDKDKNRRSVINGQVFGTLMLPYNFSFTVRADATRSNTNRQNYNNPYIGDGATNNGRLLSYAYQYTNYTAQELLNWEHEYGVNHVDVMLGHENYSWVRRYTAGMNTGMAVNGNLTMGNFLTNSYFVGSDDEYKTESYLARVRYNYDERYYADFSFRRDASSRFHKDNRWGNFYSFGLNWNIKKENFLKDVKWVDALRLRTSYGEVGNDAGVDLYGYQALYEVDKNGGEGAYIKQSLAANDLQWETTQTFDIAVEGRLFDRLDFNIGYFDKRSKDLLFQVRLPLSAGSYPHDDTMMNMAQYKNIGTISNRGFEISLNGDVIRNKDWKWSLFADATFLSNKIKKLPDGKDILNGIRKYSEGHDAYEFFTYHFEGVDQMTGNSLYTLDEEMRDKAAANDGLVEINGVEYATKTSFAKKQWAGSAMPKVYGSFGTNLTWKDLSLRMLFTYSHGGKVYDGSYQSLMSTNSASSASANHKDVLGSWNGVPEGMTETSPDRIWAGGIPVLDFNRSSDNNATSDRWLTSASYFVFKNLTISYDIPKTIINSWGIEGVTLTFGAENLWTHTSRKGLNPQYSFSGGYDDTYVTARVINFGLAVNF
jgi:TonB-linked SusC/RagA family outer membrane protein